MSSNNTDTELVGEFWALFHPELGYLTFGSYAQVRCHDKPNPRGFFTEKRHFAGRFKDTFYAKGKKYYGKDIVPKLIKVYWN